MSLLNCKKGNPTEQQILDQKLVRDLGLSSVFNVNTDVVMCTEDYTTPTYYMTGSTKPVTGLTITSEGVVNLNEVSGFTIDFVFTGSTQYTGYTGQFCYSLFSVQPFQPRCFAYSGITGTTLSETILSTEVFNFDTEYTIRSWNIFEPKECITGLTIDTSNYEPNTDNDWYLVTITNPPTPILREVIVNRYDDMYFINEVITNPIVEGSSQTQLSSTPLGGVVVLTVNGIVISTSDYVISGKLITFSVTLESTDTIQAAYNATTNERLSEIEKRNNIYQLDVFSVTGITSGVTASTVNIVNWNSTNNRLELFLEQNVDTSTEPIVTINGVNVAFNIDVYKSNITPNKLIFNSNVTIETGDILSIYYHPTGIINRGDLGTLYTDSPEITWSIPSELNITQSSGVFYIEITEDSDTNYNSIIKSGTTVYNNTTLGYNLILEPLTTNTIPNYIYRVRFVKTYTTGVVDNTYITSSVSDNGSFTIDWGYVNNTNF